VRCRALKLRPVDSRTRRAGFAASKAVPTRAEDWTSSATAARTRVAVVSMAEFECSGARHVGRPARSPLRPALQFAMLSSVHGGLPSTYDQAGRKRCAKSHVSEGELLTFGCWLGTRAHCARTRVD
jgi:hypothetical protein